MKRLRKSLGHGEKGFTLLEVLVVVALLGVLASIVGLSVVKFIGEGIVEAANTEAHNVQTAATAYMVDNDLTTYDSGDIGPTTATGTPPEPEDLLINPALIQAVYQMNDDGSIAGATPIDGSKWAELEYTPANGWVPKTT